MVEGSNPSGPISQSAENKEVTTPGELSEKSENQNLVSGLFFEEDIDMAKQEDIRHIYHELQGCLSQAPYPRPRKDARITTTEVDDDILDYFNDLVDELNGITKEDYNRFKLKKGGWTNALTYRTKLSGLISRLHGKYFQDESPPFSSMPSTIIS